MTLSKQAESQIARARDLIASGSTFAETERQTGIKQSTLKKRARREGWLVPKDHQKEKPVPPPSIKQYVEAVKADDPNPPPLNTGDLEKYLVDVLAWSVEAEAKRGQTKFLADKLPAAIRAIRESKAPVLTGIAPDWAEDVLRTVDNKTARPVQSPHDAGEIPTPGGLD